MKNLSLIVISSLILAACGSEQSLQPMTDLSETQNVNAAAVQKVSKTKFADTLASKLHDSWRNGRKKADGTYEPRIKDTKDAKWIKAHNNKTQVDIANTEYKDLPADWQKENKDSATVATNLVYKAVSDKVDFNQKFIEEASNTIHIEWLKRNTWAKGGELDVPYAKLPEVEKEKDRVIIKLAVALKTIYDADI